MAIAKFCRKYDAESSKEEERVKNIVVVFRFFKDFTVSLVKIEDFMILFKLMSLIMALYQRINPIRFVIWLPNLFMLFY